MCNHLIEPSFQRETENLSDAVSGSSNKKEESQLTTHAGKLMGEKDAIIHLLSESDDDNDESESKDEGDLNDDVVDEDEYQEPEDTLSSPIQDKLRDEVRVYSDLSDLYSRTSGSDIYGLTRGKFDSLSLTPMCLNDAYLAARVQSKRNFKLFYALEWRANRKACEQENQDCIYNLIWYEPFAGFICKQGRRPRVFISYSPLLDLDMKPTGLEFLYATYTMCDAPKFSCYVRNVVNNKIEFWHTQG
jgi:hypothetical protein